MAAEIGSMYVSLTMDARAYAAALKQADQQTAQTTSSINRNLGASRRAVEGFSRSGQNLRPYQLIAVSKGFEQAAQRAELLRGSIIALTGLFGGITAALTTNVLTRYADAMTNVRNRVSSVSDSSSEAAAAVAGVGKAADASLSSLSATATLYARIRKAVPTESAADILKVTQTVQRALVLGGSTAQEAASATLQLSQGIAANQLGGEELRAIRETPLGAPLAKALGVSIGQLKEMGAEGKLTADVLIQAFKKMGPEIDSQFEGMSVSIQNAFVVADNAVTRYIGDIDQAYGVSRQLGRAIIGLSNNLETIAPVLGVVAGLFASVFASRLILSGMSAVERSWSRQTQYIATLRESLDSARREYESLSKARGVAESRMLDAAMEMKAAQDDLRRASTGQGTMAGRVSDDLILRRDVATENLAKANMDVAAAQTKINSLRTQAITAAQRDVEIQRDAVRTEQNRISAIQERIVAEQKAIVSRAQGARTAKAEDVAATQQRISDLNLVIAGERKVMDERLKAEQAAEKARRQARVEAARDALESQKRAAVSAALAWKPARAELIELRRLMDLPGFEKEFGSQYDKALNQQGKNLNALNTANAKAQAAQDKLTAAMLAAAAPTEVTERQTRKLVSASRALEAAQRTLGAQTADLAALDERLAAARSGALSSKGLDGLLAQEAKLADRYRGEVEKLNARLDDFAKAQRGLGNIPGMAGAVKALEKAQGSVTASMKEMAAAQTEIDAVMAKGGSTDERLRALERLRTATAGFVAARGDVEQVGVQIQTLGTQLAEAESKFAKTGTGFGKAMSFIKAQGLELVGLFGGPWGVAITGATLLLGYLGTRSMKAAQDLATAQSIIKTELEQLMKTSGANNSGFNAEEFLRNEQVKVIKERVDMVKGYVDDLKTQLEKKIFVSGSGLGLNATKDEIEAFRKSIGDLVRSFVEGSTPQAEFVAKMKEIAQTRPNLSTLVTSMIEIATQARSGTLTLEQLQKKVQELQAGGDINIKVKIDFSSIEAEGLNKMASDTQAAMDKIDEEIRIARMKARGDAAGAKAAEMYNAATAKGELVDRNAYEAKARVLYALEQQAAGNKKAATAAEGYAEKIGRLKEALQGAWLSDLDRAVIDSVKGMKGATKDIEAYIAAVRSGNMGAAPKGMIEIRDLEQQKLAAQAAREIIKEYGTLDQIMPLLAQKQEQLNIAVARGAITADQAAVAMGDYLSSFGQYKWVGDLSSALGSFASSAVTNFNDIGSAVESLKKKLIELIIQLTLIAPLERMLKGALGSFAIGGFGMSSSAPVMTASGMTTGIYHGGGTVGVGGGVSRSVNPAAFIGAPRMHTGGYIGPGEVPIIAKKGETVLPPGAQLNGGGSPRINIITPPGATAQTQQRRSNGEDIIDIAITAMGDALGSGRFDNQMGARYATTPVGVRR